MSGLYRLLDTRRMNEKLKTSKMARVVIPTPLRKFTGERSTIETHGGTVKENIDHVVREYPEIQGHLYDENGSLRDFVKIYVGDEDIDALDKERTTVSADTVIRIIPAIAGGLWS